MKEHFQRLERKMDEGFTRVEDKLDGHLERLSKAEVAIEWLKGHVKITTTIVLTALSSIVVYYFTRGF